jgi:hypothetical protein
VQVPSCQLVLAAASEGISLVAGSGISLVVGS